MFHMHRMQHIAASLLHTKLECCTLLCTSILNGMPLNDDIGKQLGYDKQFELVFKSAAFCCIFAASSSRLQHTYPNQ